MATSNAPFLIFLHIAKTAGVTFNSVILRNFPGRILPGNTPGAAQNRSGMYELQDVAGYYYALDADRRSRLQACIGHNFYGLHKSIDRKCKYVALVRDPVDRCFSLYNYLIEREMIPATTSFEAFVHMDPVVCNNFMTRQICGAPSLDLHSVFDPGESVLVDGSASFCRSVTWIDYARALLNIQRNFLLCAPSERFDETLLVLARIFGWEKRDIVYEKQNATKYSVRKSDLPPNLVADLRKQNLFDERLYKFAARRFDKLIRSLGPDFQDEVVDFRNMLKIARPHRPTGSQSEH